MFTVKSYYQKLLRERENNLSTLFYLDSRDSQGVVFRMISSEGIDTNSKEPEK